MKKQLSQIQYVQNVLGIQNFFKPSSFNYQIFGSLESDCFLFFFEPYKDENIKLIKRMMNSVGISSYTCVQVQEPVHEGALQSLILRSGASRLCFFGKLWEPFLESYLKQPLALNHLFKGDINLAYTYGLEEFEGDTKTVREKKIQTFQLLKNL